MITLVHQPQYTKYTRGVPDLSYQCCDTDGSGNKGIIIDPNGEFTNYKTYKLTTTMGPLFYEGIYNGICVSAASIHPQFCSYSKVLLIKEEGLIIIPDDLEAQVLDAVEECNVSNGYIKPLLII